MAKVIVHTDEAPKSLAGYSQAVKSGPSKGHEDFYRAHRRGLDFYGSEAFFGIDTF